MFLYDGRDLSSPLILKFPAEILFMIVELGSFETWAKLVRCNKWLYKLCIPLLYREIYLHTPTQLLKLYRNRDAMRNLKKTESMFIDQVICCLGKWEGIQRRRLRPAVYLIRLLEAAVSLRRIHFMKNEASDTLLKTDRGFIKDFDNMLSYLKSYPSFLPKLEVLVNSPASGTFLSLSNHRAVAYISSLELGRLKAIVFPSLNSWGSPLTANLMPLARSRIACSAYRNPSPSSIGQLVWETTDATLLPGITFLSLKMRSADALMHNEPSPIHDPLRWVREMVAATGCSNLNSLLVEFEPKPPYQPASAQYSALRELQKILPNLTKCQITYPDISWGKYSMEGEEPRPPHLAHIDWTPEPRQRCPEALAWWLETLGLIGWETRGLGEFEQIASQLRAGMRAWWPMRSIPSEGDLYSRLMLARV